MPLSVVEFQDNTGEILVARVPFEGTAEFVTGSQLIVQDGQVAVFFRDGRPTDAFKAGRYTLSTKNLPVLSKMLNLAVYAGKSPFRAYVYYVQLKTFYNLGWGTTQPVLYRDSEFKAVHLRAFGSFSMRVSSASTFLRTLVGSQGMETTFAIEEWMRRLIVARFVNTLPSVLETVLDLAAKYDEIAVRLKRDVKDQLAQYGVELVDLVVESINVPEEIQQAINRAAGSRAYGDNEVSKVQSLAAADALRDSAQQPGGGVMAQGMAAGLGFAAAQQFAGQNAAPAPGGPPPPPAAAQWYVASPEGQAIGPFSQPDIQAQAQSGQLNPQAYVWRNGMQSWTPAAQVPELSGCFGQGPPPPPQG